jgi:probable F420-dependent oxidoreductase
MGSSAVAFSVNQAIEAVTRDDLVRAARDAETKGFAAFTVADHFNVPMAPFTALAIVAEVTSTLRVAPYVLDNDFHHPSITAREAATLDVLSGGRFDFGLGAGWKQPEYIEAGFVFDPPAVRIARLSEALTVYEGLFSGEPVYFSGEFYRLEGLVCRPQPMQRPRPPILIGAGSPRMLRLAAERADIISLAVKATPDGRMDSGDILASGLDEKLSWIHKAAGGRFDRLRFNVPLMDVVIGPDRRALARAKLDDLRHGRTNLAYTRELTVEDLLESPYFLFGTVDDIVEHLGVCHDRYDLTSWSQLGRVTDSLAPVIEALG